MSSKVEEKIIRYFALCDKCGEATEYDISCKEKMKFCTHCGFPVQVACNGCGKEFRFKPEKYCSFCNENLHRGDIVHLLGRILILFRDVGENRLVGLDPHGVFESIPRIRKTYPIVPIDDFLRHQFDGEDRYYLVDWKGSLQRAKLGVLIKPIEDFLEAHKSD